MIKRRRAAFLKLARLLRAIEANLDDLAAVKRLNLALVKEIVRDEGHIQRLRADIKQLKRGLKTDRPNKANAAHLRREIKRLERATGRYANQIFIWKCLGDGLVYAYVSTFNIKHAFFDTESTAIRPDAGFLSGKAGLKLELDILKAVLKQGVSAVLSDVTNVLRHGDVCLLAGTDLSFIEVKSSKSLNQRGRRQMNRLDKLSRFLINDVEPGFRGLPDVRRTALHVEVRDCLDDLNRCVESAKRDGFNAVSPERGLVYLTCYDDDAAQIEEMLAGLSMTAPIAFFPNADKNDRSWAPYLPFVTSLRDVDCLYDFIVGDLKIFVFVDGAHICNGLLRPGCRVSLLDDGNMAIAVEDLSTGGHVALSQQFMRRLGFEFLSPAWFIEENRAMIASIFTEMQLREATEAEVPFANAANRQVSEMPRRYSVEAPPL